jgi:hypothetical protein
MAKTKAKIKTKIKTGAKTKTPKERRKQVEAYLNFGNTVTPRAIEVAPGVHRVASHHLDRSRSRSGSPRSRRSRNSRSRSPKARKASRSRSRSGSRNKAIDADTLKSLEAKGMMLMTKEQFESFTRKVKSDVTIITQTRRWLGSAVVQKVGREGKEGHVY